LGDPDEGDRQRVEWAPIEAGAEYVAITDVAAFYEYVDHSRLTQDIVELTGDVELASAIQDQLSEVMGREFGLPQGPRSSDILADLYLSAVDRALTRAGIQMWRFNDDFVLAASSERHAQLLIQRLDHALRPRGLALNNAKNRVTGGSTYRGWVETLKTRLSEAAIAEATVGGYSFFDPEAFSDIELGDLPVDAVEQMLTATLDSDEPDPYNVNDRLLPQALQILAKARSTVPLERLDDLVSDWPSHARVIALYLRSLIGVPEESTMIAAVVAVLHDGEDLVPWVRGWLLDPLARCDGRLGSRPVSGLILDWLLREHEPWFVRGRCALVQAQRHRILEQEAFSDLFERAPAPAQADLAAAVVLAQPDWAEAWVRTLRGSPPLLRRIPDLIDRTDIRAEVL